MTDDYVQISEVNGEKRWNMRCARDYDDDDDQLVIEQVTPTVLHVTTNYHR
jgi:hypothetical protein